jgi:hypothetical protein
MLTRRPALFLVTLLLAAGSFTTTTALAATTGSGRAAQEVRTPGADFQAIELRGDFDLTVRQADGGARIELHADDNLLPMIETEVVDGRHGRTLRIGWRRDAGWVHPKVEARVTVQVAQLRAVSAYGSGDISIPRLAAPLFSLSLAGSGDARLDELATDELSVSVAGSGDVHASGRAGRLTLAIAGSGDVSAAGLASDEVTVRIAGSGDAHVHAERQLKVSIAGSGDVQYSGAAAVQSSIAGSGSVRKR